MPGSVGDPVRIGPFRRIVEVGWPARLVAFRLTLGTEEGDIESVACFPSEGAKPSNYEQEWFSRTSMKIGVGLARRYSETTGEWSFISGETYTGEPETPFENIFADGEIGTMYSPEGPHRLTLSGGSTIPDIPVPDRPAANFLSSVALGYDVLGQVLDPGDLHCYTGLGPQNSYKNLTPPGPGEVVLSDSIGLSGIVVTVGLRNYVPIGCYLVPNTKGNAFVEISAPVVAWILCDLDVTA